MQEGVKVGQMIDGGSHRLTDAGTVTHVTHTRQKRSSSSVCCDHYRLKTFGILIQPHNARTQERKALGYCSTKTAGCAGDHNPS